MWGYFAIFKSIAKTHLKSPRNKSPSPSPKFLPALLPHKTRWKEQSQNQHQPNNGGLPGKQPWQEMATPWQEAWGETPRNYNHPPGIMIEHYQKEIPEKRKNSPVNPWSQQEASTWRK